MEEEQPGGANPRPAGPVRVGEWLFEPSLNRLSRDEERIELEPLAARLLEVLSAAPGRVFSNDELVAAVWQGRIVSDNPIYKLVANLRRTLGDERSSPRYIETIRKRGYRLVAAVESVAAVSATPTGSAAREPPRPSRGLSAGHVVMGALAVAVLVLLWLSASMAPPEPEAAGSGSGAPVVAVLPFEDLSPARDRAYLADGAAEELIGALTRLDGVGVIGRTSSFAYRDRTADVREVGQALGARYLVAGTVARSADRIRISVELIDAASGLQLWSGRVERGVAELAAAQAELTRQVTSAVAGLLDLDGVEPETVARAATKMEAYEAYLQGRHQVAQGTASAAGEAERAFGRALELDPGLVQAMNGFVESQYLLSFHGQKPAAEAWAAAAPWAERALALAPDRPEVHVAMGRLNLLEADWASAEQALRTALELDADYPEALSALAWLLYSASRPEEAAPVFERALAVEPAAALLFVSAAMNVEDLGDFRCAETLYERAAELAPELMNAQFALGSFRWRIRRDYEAAERRLSRAMRQDPDGPIPPATLALSWLDRGDAERSGVLVDQAMALGPDAYWPLFARLAHAVYVDDTKLALRTAERLLGFSFDPYALRVLRDRALADGDMDAAIDVYPDWLIASEDVEVTRQNVRLAADLAWAYAAAGQSERARDIATKVLRVTEGMPRLGWRGFQLADVTAARILGGVDAGIERLSAAKNEGWQPLWWFSLEHDPALTSLRDHPGYEALALWFAGEDRLSDDGVRSVDGANSRRRCRVMDIPGLERAF